MFTTHSFQRCGNTGPDAGDQSLVVPAFAFEQPSSNTSRASTRGRTVALDSQAMPTVRASCSAVSDVRPDCAARFSGAPLVLISSAYNQLIHNRRVEKKVMLWVPLVWMNSPDIARKAGPTRFNVSSSWPALWLFMEDRWECAERRVQLELSVSGRDLSVCRDDIFAAEPRLLPLMRNDSLISSFYDKVGAWEPLQGALSYQTGKTLVRKVAAVYHALHSLPYGTIVLWCDFDSMLLTTLEEPAFQEFLSRHDFAYIPMRGKSHAFWTKSPFDMPWLIESGVMAFTVNARSRALAAAALQLYEGGMLNLREVCARKLPPADCGEPWLETNLFLNDVYVWTLLAHGLHHNSSLLRKHIPSFHRALGLRQAWFGVHASCPNNPATLNASGMNTSRILSMTNPERVTQLDIIYAAKAYCSNKAGNCPCPGTNHYTAPWSLTDFIYHDLKSGRKKDDTPSALSSASFHRSPRRDGFARAEEGST